MSACNFGPVIMYYELNIWVPIKAHGDSCLLSLLQVLEVKCVKGVTSNMNKCVKLMAYSLLNKQLF